MTIETVTTLVGNVLDLCTTGVTYLVANPVLGFGIGCALVGLVFGVVRRALHTAR